jgi:hypothetical protein
VVQRKRRKPGLAALRNSDALRKKEKASRADEKLKEGEPLRLTLSLVPDLETTQSQAGTRQPYKLPDVARCPGLR